MKIIIVGGVAAGAACAARLRRLREDVKIILLERGEFISYANCGLPYYIGNTIEKRSSLLVTTAENLNKRFNIDVRTGSEAVAIDTVGKSVRIRKEGKEYDENYDALVLALGAKPKLPRVAGVDAEGLFTLRTLDDATSMHDYIEAKRPKRAVVVGAGFIGMELTENLRAVGMEVTVVEFADQVLPFLDRELAQLMREELEKNGVAVKLNAGLSGVEKYSDGMTLTLSTGETLEAQLAVVSVGAAPDSALAGDAGIALGLGGAIAVDAQYRTSAEDVYACGDCIEVESLITRKPTLVPLAGIANKQGRAVASAIAGRETEALKVQGTAIVKVFDLTAAACGMNEAQLTRAGIAFESTSIHPPNHATYYPGSSQIHLKLLYASDGTILGAQGVGKSGIDKRMDVVATVQRLGGKIEDLQTLELCYAPPFSSAKDPVNLLGYTAGNQLSGDVKHFYAREVDTLNKSVITLLDVRTVGEYAGGTIDGAINIELDSLRSLTHLLEKDKPVYLFCQAGLRGYYAARVLSQQGFEAYNLVGGYLTYAAYKRSL